MYINREVKNQLLTSKRHALAKKPAVTAFLTAWNIICNVNVKNLQPIFQLKPRWYSFLHRCLLHMISGWCLISEQSVWVDPWFQPLFSVKGNKNKLELRELKLKCKCQLYYYTHHGLEVEKILVTPLWRLFRLKEPFVYIQERDMVTLNRQERWFYSVKRDLYIDIVSSKL